MNMKCLIVTIGALYSLSSLALSDVGLTHRWSFNGDLLNSLGKGALYPRDTFVLVDLGSATFNGVSTWLVDGDAFSTDGEVFNFKGGQVRAESSWETTGVNGPEICSSDSTELTIELWAAQHSWQAYSSIFQLGETGGIGMFWDCSKGTEYSTNGLIKIDGARVHLSLSERVIEHKTCIGSYDVGVQYHIAMVISKQANGSWKFVSYKQNAQTGETICREEHTKDSSWSFANLENFRLSLGFGDFDKDNFYGEVYGAHAIYDEVRVWNRALTEQELTESAKEGPNPRRFGQIPTMENTDVYATNIATHFRSDTNGLLDVEFDVVGQSEDVSCIVLQAEDLSTHSIYTAKSVSGDWSFASGHHKVLWDFAADGIDLPAENVRYIVSSPLYCVIDLSNGRDATSYPVTYLSRKPLVWTDDYKTTKLVMRWCGAGVEDKGSFSSAHNYYAGVFELTKGQYNQIYDDGPYIRNRDGATLPAVVHSSSSVLSRGASFSEFGWAIEGSIVDRLRRCTKLGGISVPKDVIWRYTCLAGDTDKNYCFGNDASLIGEYAWYADNSESAIHIVGGKACNDWGLYDMHGNSAELVISTTATPTFNLCGGSRDHYASGCRASSYCAWTATSTEDWYGVRLFMSAPWDVVVVGTYIPEIVTSSITYENLRGATHDNPSTYTEGTAVALTNPSSVTGYSFVRWEPSAITADMTGNQTVRAVWKANDYSIVFHVNGGSGKMDDLRMTYDAETSITSNVFSRSYYTFKGWATEENGAVVYTDGSKVKNLTALKDGTVDLHAVWELTSVPDPVVSPSDGSSFSTASCAVTLTCPIEGAFIYYTTNGTTPKISATYQYTQPFSIYGTVSVKAIAIIGSLKSGYTIATISKVDPIPVATPIITPADGSVFSSETCEVAITCPTDGATIYYTTDGKTPKTTAAYRYDGPFMISGTATIKAVAIKEGWLKSSYATATITKVSLTLEGVLGCDSSVSVTTGGAANWLPVNDSDAKDGGTCARSGLGHVDNDAMSWIQLLVNGKGTLSFWCKTSCEHDDDNAYSWDRLEVTVDGVAKSDWRMDGVTKWIQRTVTFDTDLAHEVKIIYVKDGSDYAGEDCAWIDSVVWTPSAAPVGPSVDDDPGATVTGDASTGYVIKPSDGKTSVEVTIPTGVEPSKVTVEVSSSVETIRPNGASVKVVKGTSDITSYLDIPTAVDGVVNLGAAEVKTAIVKEAMDPAAGAQIEINAENPSLTTSATKPGLVYTLREGASLESMASGDSKVGDGQPWTPNVTVKGGTSGFYSISVGK